ncbi:hypothetical protein [Kitasatospora aureofaciens]|uniref:hypothetical protein n=1 Tax=Kitasatospora aureofaciens TaxID=1894 RepID=UPI001C47ABE9|nr:hypothetical protein [Kitasatospora aureofaciens]MBV6697106.1 hypothetical protein [Kitasatospora aureofaciens]
MSRSRTDRSPARRVLAVCALTGAALLTAVTGGQAWADGSPAPAPSAPSVSAGASAAGAAPSVPRSPQPAQAPAVAPKGAPASPEAPRTSTPAPGQPQVREVPKGAAKAGDGSGSTAGSGLMLAGGGTVAAVGAGALGFALLRRRSGARA